MTSYWTKRRKLKAVVAGYERIIQFDNTELLGVETDNCPNLSSVISQDSKCLTIQKTDTGDIVNKSPRCNSPALEVIDFEGETIDIIPSTFDEIQNLCHSKENLTASSEQSLNCATYDFSSSIESGSESPSCNAVDATELGAWACENKITHTALSGLLKILRKTNPNLPSHPRTLLQTLTSFQCKPLAGGTYHYMGIKSGILKQLAFQDFDCFQNISIQVNIDGLPLYKSTCDQFWPILGLVEKHDSCVVQTNKEPFIIGIYHGKHKPSCASDFLQDFVSEAEDLEKNGLWHENKHYTFTISAFICDTPARAFIKSTKGHTGYSGCDKCIQHGVYINNRMSYPETSAQLRTDEGFKNMTDQAHHLGPSILCRLSIGMITNMPLDYMHLVCLGVMKKLIFLWRKGPLKTRISQRDFESISRELLFLGKSVPSEFARKPRAITEFERWKATEFRQFLIYTGPMCLAKHVSKEVYQNFMLLSLAMHILLDPFLCHHYCDYAHSLLVCFVEQFSKLYGKEYVSYNVHGLVHLGAEVKKFGVLDNISAFPFENFLGHLKRLVRKSGSPLQQVIRRLSEQEAMDKVVDSFTKPVVKQEHYSNYVPRQLYTVLKGQYKELRVNNFCIKLSEGNHFAQLNNGDIVMVQNIVVDSNDQIHIVYNKFMSKEDFFTVPSSSSTFNIFKLNELQNHIEECPVVQIRRKFVVFPYKSGYVGKPLLHSNTSV